MVLVGYSVEGLLAIGPDESLSGDRRSASVAWGALHLNGPKKIAGFNWMRKADDRELWCILYLSVFKK